MAQSEQQKAVLELGRLLVKELNIENSVDTLSRWMAHYVAEKISYADSLPDGIKKKNAEKECFSLILELWKHRWQYKSDRQPLRSFNQLYDILKNLDPEKEEPFYYRLPNEKSKEVEAGSFELSDLKNLSAFALQIDKVARIWINYLLHKAAATTNNEKIKKIIDCAVKIPDSIDASIIQIVYADIMDDIDKKLVDKEEMKSKSKIETLNCRINELQKFKKINEYLISEFEKELNDFKK